MAQRTFRVWRPVLYSFMRCSVRCSHRGERQENQVSYTYRSWGQEARLPHGATWENTSAISRQELGRRLPGPWP